MPSAAVAAGAGALLRRLPQAVLRGATPAYVYDLAELRRNAAALLAALPAGALVYYSLKANPHPLLQAALRQAGVLAEVCSPGELEACLAAGFAPAQVLYTGPGKRDEEVEQAVRLGVREFSTDSPVGLAQLDATAAAAGTTLRCLLRVNGEQPARGQGLAMTGVASQFGADTGWVLAEPRRFAGTPRARVVGLHLYMGTNLVAISDLLGQFEQALRTAAALREALSGHGASLDVLDLGGGFGAPFAGGGSRLDLHGLHSRLEALLDRWAPGWRGGVAAATWSGPPARCWCGCSTSSARTASRSSCSSQASTTWEACRACAGCRHSPCRWSRWPAAATAPRTRPISAAARRWSPARCAPRWTPGVARPSCRDRALASCSPCPTSARTGCTPAWSPSLATRCPQRSWSTATAPTPSSTCRSSGWSASPPAASRSRPVPQAPIQEGTTEMDPTFTEVIRPFLRFAGDQPIEEHTNLREMGLDSMKAIDLLFAIEDEFDITLADDLMTDATFQTAGSLWGALRESRGDPVKAADAR